MGKAGYLPDISSTFNFFRAYAVNALAREDYTEAAAGLHSINSSLDEKYIININDAEFKRETAENRFYNCNFCTMEIEKIINKGQEDQRTKIDIIPSRIPSNQVYIMDWMPPGLLSVMTSHERIKAWRCPKCDETNPLVGTNVINVKNTKPYFRSVIGNPPRQGIGISTRLSFIVDFKKWFFDFLEQLNHTMMNYRVDFAAQHGTDMAEPMYKDKGDK